jgi:predicted RecA/RadA family phage recombinase
MATNKIQDGDSLDTVLTADVAPGGVVVLGDLVGICEVGGKTGETRSISYTGVFRLPKATGAGSGFPQGTLLYWDPAAGKLTETAGSLKLAGKAWKTEADASTTADVRLLG